MWNHPAKATHRYAVEFGATRFEVDPEVGGRITEFSAGGHNVLIDLFEVDGWTNGGSTFWTSPQGDWGWPPNPQLDRGRYEVTLDRTTNRLTLTSPRFEVAGSPVRVSKHFTPDPEREAIGLDYRIINYGAPLVIAPWEISRVAAHGVSFFAGSEPEAQGGRPKPEVVTDAGGVVWMDHDAQEIEAKLGAASTEGFLAFATPSLLFVKTFTPIQEPEVVPDGEAEIELYVKAHQYVEIEQQGAVRRLEAGHELSYRLSWQIRPLPPHVAVCAASQALLAFTRQVAGLP